jgi:NAD(P) transhydrogenase subunit alpha
MDALSSMANLAGYRAAILGAEALPKMFPMMMTAAGTIVPAKAFVVGVGVAGLQAIATTRRLGAVVSAYDVRPAVKEQVESLGAKFVEMELESAEGAGGYAKAMDEEFYRRQRELMGEVIAGMDLVITTAAIPGRPSPVLVTAAMVERMSPGSVIVDLATERGGNCELSEAGRTVVKHGVTIVGPTNIPSALAFNASQLYSRNITTFLLAMAKDGELVVDTNDEIVAATLVTRDGEIPNAEIRERLGG